MPRNNTAEYGYDDDVDRRSVQERLSDLKDEATDDFRNTDYALNRAHKIRLASDRVTELRETVNLHGFTERAKPQYVGNASVQVFSI